MITNAHSNLIEVLEEVYLTHPIDEFQTHNESNNAKNTLK